VKQSVRFGVLARHDFACAYCGRRPPEVSLQVDHVHPRSRGGDDDPSNLVAACFQCNIGKGARPIPYCKEKAHIGWCQFVWEWIGGFGVASEVGMPPRAEILEMFKQRGISETVELVGDARWRLRHHHEDPVTAFRAAFKQAQEEDALEQEG
jgi:hypothetical protein